MSELLNRVNWIDVFALILLIRISYISARIGVGKQILPLILLALVLSGTLYNYSRMASFFMERYSFSSSISRFLSYFLITVVFFIIYHIASRITGFYLSPTREEAGFIENIGGMFLGLLRSSIIIGIIITGLALMPIRGIEKSIMDSYSGTFFIDTNLKIYNSIIDFILKDDEISYRKTAREFLSEKKDYLFKSLDKRRKLKSYEDIK
ncbi:MAG: CvpA family protein [Candidatus Omnitrophota bacterium]|nr:MAG: CvpA family protein [Candidatus Omnitrophota bacterium]